MTVALPHLTPTTTFNNKLGQLPSLHNAVSSQFLPSTTLATTTTTTITTSSQPSKSTITHLTHLLLPSLVNFSSLVHPTEKSQPGTEQPPKNNNKTT
jgi:hypothetical protein